ncbi:MAG: hypothetical protein NT062_20325 [Proteobacteria bacterium]|nr:hypothetical protein [Pseudomonadota bacterium]
MRRASSSVLGFIVVAAAATPVVARDAHVTARTPTTIYIDAGTADGLATGAAWQTTIDGRPVALRVVAAALHDAVVELGGGPPPAIGATLDLPAGLVAATPVALQPPPPPSRPWSDDAGAAALLVVRTVATATQLAASLGRQPGAPLGELGSVDGGRARFALPHAIDATGFAGLRPASDLGLAFAPRAGVDLGWQHVADRLRARADLGLAVDQYKGGLDRAATAARATVATSTLVVSGETVVDLSHDANGDRGARLTRASVEARDRDGRFTTAVSASYDRPFLDRALAAELSNPAEPYGLTLGPRTEAAIDVSYAMTHAMDLGISERASSGDGFRAAYLDVNATWRAPSGRRLDVVPHLVLGTLADELGVRAGLSTPWRTWWLSGGASLDRIWTSGQQAWSGLGHVSGSRPIGDRWRTAVTVEGGGGDGPARLLLFGTLAYRLGK